MLSPILLPEAEDPYLDERDLDPSQVYFYHRQVILELVWSEITPPDHRNFLVLLLKSSSN